MGRTIPLTNIKSFMKVITRKLDTFSQFDIGDIMHLPKRDLGKMVNVLDKEMKRKKERINTKRKNPLFLGR